MGSGYGHSEVFGGGYESYLGLKSQWIRIGL